VVGDPHAQVRAEVRTRALRKRLRQQRRDAVHALLIGDQAPPDAKVLRVAGVVSGAERILRLLATPARRGFALLERRGPILPARRGLVLAWCGLVLRGRHGRKRWQQDGSGQE
jgi:hypothetical protein